MTIKDKIAAASRAKILRERVTFLGEEVEVRGMTVGQRSHVMDVGYTKGRVQTPEYTRFYPALLIATLYEPGKDKPIFTDADVSAINELDPSEVDAVVSVALRLSGLDKGAETTAEGNSTAASED